MKKWIVFYFNQYDEIVGPVWEIESRIKPTSWAKRAFHDWNVSFRIKEVAEFQEGYRESFLRA